MKTIHTKNAPEAIGPYSQAIEANGFLFTSGQIAIDPKTGEIEGDSIAEQSEQVMKNIGAILEAGGVTFKDVVKTTCFLADMADFAEFNGIYEKYFVSKPTRSCVAAKSLPKNVLVEMEVTAYIAKETLINSKIK